MAEIDYENLGEPEGQENNMGGTKQVIYYAPVRDFLSIKAPVAVPTNPEEVVEIADTHTFKTGKCFKTLYVTLDKGQVMFEPQGDRDGRSFKQKATVFHPGAKSKAIGTASLVKNDTLIFEIPLADGQVIQIGSADFYAEMLPKFDSASNSAGVRGWQFDIESMNPVNLVYKGAITVTPAP